MEETKEDLVLQADEEIIFSVENITNEKIKLATNIPAYDNNNLIIPCAQVLHANAQNKIGEVLLTAEHRQIIDEEHYNVLATYTKTVEIIPLW